MKAYERTSEQRNKRTNKQTNEQRVKNGRNEREKSTNDCVDKKLAIQ